MPNVVVYGKEQCPNCVIAKNVLKSKNIPFEYIDVTESDDSLMYVRSEWQKMGMHPSVPAIKVDEQFLGGLTELKNFLKDK